jgi:adenosylcobyric acid synthase
MHGLFDTPAIIRRWLDAVGLEHLDTGDTPAGPAARDREYDRLAEHFGQHVDTEAILRLVQRMPPP